MNKLSDRRKRRGYIEKKRRDRLNNSLFELKRLVPRASERELSEKLEKADILQLTVEYLETLNVSPDADSQDPNIDYKELGFRNCISEISRFFSDTDGSQNSLHLRLIAHLQYFTDAAKSDEAASISGMLSTNPTDMNQLFVNYTSSILLNQGWFLSLANSLYRRHYDKNKDS